MDGPQPASSVPEEFWQKLARANERLLILDYDGTLAPLTVQRDEAYPYHGVVDLLRRLTADNRSRVVIVSGRSAQDVKRLLGITPAPEIWGSHGFERLRPEGRAVRSELSPAKSAALKQGEQLVRAYAEREAIELKPGCVAFHWRGKSDAEIRQLERRVRAAWRPLARFGLETHSFDGGLELRASGIDKGRVVNQLLAELGSSYGAAYLGDDLTDEDAFAALKGKGLTVLVRPDYRDTRAEVWLRPPGELLEFLKKWSEVL